MGAERAVTVAPVCPDVTHVVTAFVRHGGELLLVRRGGRPRHCGAGRQSEVDRWDGVSRCVDTLPDDPVATARGALDRLVGIEDATHVVSGDSFVVSVDDCRWTILPLLFEIPSRELDVVDEIEATTWVPAPELRDRPTVPGLREAYRRVGPTVETVTTDTTHGSAWLSARALEVLRDLACVSDSWEPVVAAARQLRAGQPDMAAVSNRVDRAMARAVDAEGAATSPPAWDPVAVVDPIQRTLRETLQADERAATQSATLLAERFGPDPVVATLSRSGTASDALQRAQPRVLVGESRPACEGAAVATTLAGRGLDVTLTTDAALPWALAGEADGPRPDLVLVGADAVLPDGTIVNKVGTRSLGLAASRADVPLYVVAARDKIATAERHPTARSDPEPLAPGSGVETWTPTFDRTPPDCVTGIVVEDGIVKPGDVAGIAHRHRRHATWGDAFD